LFNPNGGVPGNTISKYSDTGIIGHYLYRITGGVQLFGHHCLVITEVVKRFTGTIFLQGLGTLFPDMDSPNGWEKWGKVKNGGWKKGLLCETWRRGAKKCHINPVLGRERKTGG